MRAIVLLIVVGVLTPLAACASAAAKAPPDRPTLEVPSPPTRVVDPSPRPEPTTTPEPVPELPPANPPNTRTAKPPVREPARPDSKSDATPPTETPAAPVAPVSPPPQLRPANTPDAGEAAKQAQTAIEHARQTLNSLNAKQIRKDKKPVYDDAQRMLASADEAFKKSDFDNAKKLAEKVESTARELGAR